MPKLTAIRKQALDDIMKEAIFEATVAVLGQHGVEGMTMDRVATAAGVAKGSLYRYFRGKRALLEFVFAKTIDPIFQSLEEIAAADMPALEKLAELLRKLLDNIAQHVQLHKLLFKDESTHGILQSSERRTIEAACQRIAEIFRQGIEEGVFRPADPLMLAGMYFGLCRGALQTQPEIEELNQREDLHHLILGTFLHGVAAEKTHFG
ncbi:MAG: TetR/AcrR family transcriptional regulator [Pirellulaceae bacterium]|nr:TetR/AcrR family transcriptional regulator [Pirellulaceae bacterium]